MAARTLAEFQPCPPLAPPEHIDLLELAVCSAPPLSRPGGSSCEGWLDLLDNFQHKNATKDKSIPIFGRARFYFSPSGAVTLSRPTTPHRTPRSIAGESRARRGESYRNPPFPPPSTSPQSVSIRSNSAIRTQSASASAQNRRILLPNSFRVLPYFHFLCERK